MSSKPEQVRGARHCNQRYRRCCKIATKRKRRRLERRLLDDTPRLIIKGWAD